MPTISFTVFSLIIFLDWTACFIDLRKKMIQLMWHLKYAKAKVVSSLPYTYTDDKSLEPFLLQYTKVSFTQIYSWSTFFPITILASVGAITRRGAIPTETNSTFT